MITVNEREIKFEKGMTVADAIKAAGEPVDAMTLVVVDGKVLPSGRLDLELADGMEIRLWPVVSGG